MTHANFGELPLSLRSTQLQLTLWPGLNAPGPCGPAAMFIAATFVGVHTCDRCRIARRWSGVTADAGLCPPKDAHAPATVVSATSVEAMVGFMMSPEDYSPRSSPSG